ncbi:MAG: exosortase system-associated hydrolase 2 [Acidimicrobiales bacterium]|nr:exosortase system-associated hydrolase 2 [Acidimicrobiales bacterium]
MIAEPVWIGPIDRPLFGWLHVPADGTARGGVVLCPPLGYEHLCAHRAMRVLAERLAGAGLAVLRLDYDGTGDSAGGSEDPGRVRAWIDSIGVGIEALRQRGADAVAVVGLRLGATLASVAVAEHDVHAAVLWDPTWAGSRFVRQLRALHLIGVGTAHDDDSDDGSLAVAGTVYTAETVAELRTLEIPDLSDRTTPVLVLHRPDAPPPAADLARLPVTTEREEVLGQEHLVDVDSSLVHLPEATLARISRWLGASMPTVRRPVVAEPDRRVAAVAPGLHEAALRLGPLGLFAVRTTPDDGVPAGRPTLLLLNTATEVHLGPNRAWVDWGRHIARLGYCVVRADISGLGDSPVRPGQRVDLPYPPEATADVGALVGEVDQGGGVVLVGLCSGARNALDAAVAVGARGVCVVNTPLHYERHVLETIMRGEPPTEAFLAAQRFHRWRYHLSIRLPEIVWRTLDRIGAVPSPARPYQHAVQHGVDVVAVYGEGEDTYVRVGERGAWHLRHLARRPGFALELVPGLDHSAMARSGRHRLLDVLTRCIVDRYDAGTRATVTGAAPTAISSRAPAPGTTAPS